MNQKLLEEISQYEWKWNKQTIKIKDLKLSQLLHIKNFVRSNKRIHYGMEASKWFSNISYYINNHPELSKEVIKNRQRIIDGSTTKLFNALLPKQLKIK